MNCLEFKQLKLTDPNSVYLKASEHQDNCVSCAVFCEETLKLDANLQTILTVATPKGLVERLLLYPALPQKTHRPTQWLRLGLAASFLAAILTGVYQYNQAPSYINSDFMSLLVHANHQPHKFYSPAHYPVLNIEVENVLKAYQVQANFENIVYAANCPFESGHTAHLIIKDGQSQYTVILLPERSPSKMFTIHDDIWHGYISPHPAGALAVLAEAEDEQAVSRIEAVRDKIHSAIYLTVEV